MTKRFTGSTEDAGGVFLGADFWKKGTKVEGVVQGNFMTSNGLAYNLSLKKPVKVNGEEESKVSIGNMKGFLMALRAGGIPIIDGDPALLVGDALIIECTGTTPTTKGNDQVNFKVLVERP